MGLDIGHSAVKGVVSGERGIRQFMFPSVVCRAINISDETEARRAALDTVEVDGVYYFVGDTAIIQGGAAVPSGLSDDWIETKEHAALVESSLKRLRTMGYPLDDALVVMGLPSRLHDSQAARLKELFLKHCQAELKVVPQPMGAYQATMLQESGMPVVGRDIKTESWGVVEVGRYSTDFMLMMGGRWVQRASGGTQGVSAAAAHLQTLLRDRHQLDVDLLDCEKALSSGSTFKSIKNYGKSVDVTAETEMAAAVLVSDVVDMANRLIDPFARKLDGVIVAGGGAPFVYRELHSRWPHAIMADDPRFAVARGFHRFGCALNLMRMHSKHKALV